jgi:hypothetical protein
MRVLYIVLALILTNLPTTGNLTANAEGRQQSHIVIAADHSDSMHNSGNIRTQTTAIVAAVQSYVNQCGHTEVTYLPWGALAYHPHTFMLTNEASRQTFISTMRDKLPTLRLGNTNHGLALQIALHILRDSDVRAIVFITDGVGAPVQLKMPADTLLFKLSLDTLPVSRYLQQDFLPGYGHHYHANSAEKLQRDIADIFLSMEDACIS